MPALRGVSVLLLLGNTILTGMRCTTFTKLPVALSGGKRLNLAPVAAAIDSIEPSNSLSL